MVSTPALRFTYQDYLLLPEERRYEILDGDLFMTPAPTPYHQRISRKLEFLLVEHVEERQLGEVFDAPCDVVLSETDIVQPDIFFIASDRLSIVGEKFVSGAPDLVIEILSPATAERDRTLKMKTYARFGVRELWVADPDAKTIALFTNSGQGFQEEALLRMGEVLRSRLLPGLEIPLTRIF
jgi:Uma2 family endonuclease